jgi:hypothetical protein
MQITISEAIGNLKMLKDRHEELLALRNKNAEKETRFYGANADKSKEFEPVYDVKKLDALVTNVAREIRKLDTAIKWANSKTVLANYDWEDSVLGQVE